MDTFTETLFLNLSPLEWLLFLALAVAVPLSSFLSLKSFMRKPPSDLRTWRRKTYRENVLMLWSLCIFGAFVWVVQGRTAIAAGLMPAAELWQLALGLLGAATGSYLLLRPQDTPDAQAHQSTIELLEKDRFLNSFTPESDEDLTGWSILSVTAGITEEILYRGMLISLMAPTLGVLGGAVASVVIFSLAHAYQGGRGMLRVAAVGAVLTVIVLLSGAIWPAVILHIAVDISSGRTLLLLKRAIAKARHDGGDGAPVPA